jgi:hypothetical protein
MIAVVILTLLAEIPSVNAWITGATVAHGHLVVFIEGIIGLILVWLAGQKGAMIPGGTK